MHYSDHYLLQFYQTSAIIPISDWNNALPSYQFKLMLCKALNYCSEYAQLRLVGYLITERNLYWVPHNTVEEMTEIFETFNFYLRAEIESELEWIQSAFPSSEQTIPENIVKKLHQEPLFEQQQLLDIDLIRTLIGMHPTVPHKTPHIKYLDDLTQNNNFCSVKYYDMPLKDETKGPVELWSIENELPDTSTQLLEE